MKFKSDWKILIVIFALALTACGKKDDGGGGAPAPQSTPPPPPPPPAVTTATGGYDNGYLAQGRVILGQPIQGRAFVMTNFEYFSRLNLQIPIGPVPGAPQQPGAPAPQNASINDVPATDRAYFLQGGWGGGIYLSEQSHIMFFFEPSGSLSVAAKLNGELFRGYNIPYEYRMGDGSIMIANFTLSNISTPKSSIADALQIRAYKSQGFDRKKSNRRFLRGFYGRLQEFGSGEYGSIPYATSPTSYVDLQDRMIVEIKQKPVYFGGAQAPANIPINFDLISGGTRILGDETILKPAAGANIPAQGPQPR